MEMNIRIEIIRSNKSFTFSMEKLAPVYLDSFQLYVNESIQFESRCQSVAIYNCSILESIAPMVFECRLFAEQRTYAHPVHELINAIDMEGEEIDGKAMQIDAEAGIQGRWLIHDDFNPKTGKSYSRPWSAGCIIIPWQDYISFNNALKNLGFVRGDIIPIEIKEV